MTPGSLPFTENAEANRLLAVDPTALLIGMLLDQQFPMERAFLAPHLLRERLGGRLDTAAVAGLDDATLDAVFSGPPALHRFPSSMGRRCRDLCTHIVEEYDADASRIWTGSADGAELLRRLEALPGFGKAKARIFVGVVGKRLGAGPPGWEEVAADWPSIADVDSFDKVTVLREQKRAIKAAKKTGRG
ncbi:MAG TPA: HhH-GPD-type base excision DNA repair protein [Acidimicrobiia bacterium]|nr:HhH-GPD-type base excision DNA repair protein [Acidimicrobiia bacterium]